VGTRISTSLRGTRIKKRSFTRYIFVFLWILLQDPGGDFCLLAFTTVLFVYPEVSIPEGSEILNPKPKLYIPGFRLLVGRFLLLLLFGESLVSN
jgi:hypothetical protein